MIYGQIKQVEIEWPTLIESYSKKKKNLRWTKVLQNQKTNQNKQPKNTIEHISGLLIDFASFTHQILRTGENRNIRHCADQKSQFLTKNFKSSFWGP